MVSFIRSPLYHLTFQWPRSYTALVLPKDLESVSQNLMATSINASYVGMLSDTSSCQRDIPLLLELEMNVIRTYGVDPTKDHSQCMQDLANAGISL